MDIMLEFSNMTIYKNTVQRLTCYKLLLFYYFINNDVSFSNIQDIWHLLMGIIVEVK